MAGLLFAGGCRIGYESIPSGEATGTEDGGLVEDGGRVVDAGQVVDAGETSSTDGAPMVMCTPGGTLSPVSAFHATEYAGGESCDVDNLLVQDGLTAGVDRIDSTVCPYWDGESACGCAGVDFGAVVTVSDITVRAAPTGQGCSTPCTDTFCGTGQSFVVYAATEIGSYVRVRTVPMGSATLTQYTSPFAGDLQYVVVCHSGFGPVRDDIAFDHISITCP